MISLSALTVAMAWAAPASNALPSGGVVSYGQASISQSGSTLTINQSSNKAIANWQSFDIGAAAHVNVNQPGSNAVLLNRVVGNSPSQIFGKLDANGQVILVNPNGVLFGQGGSVNTGGFTASTYSLSDADFIAGNYRYYRNGSTASVVNEGSINVADGGYVALIGAAVSNSGQIVVPHGTVGMAAGEVVNVPLSASGKITFELTPASINTSVSNTAGGIIQAADGQVYMRAASLNGALASILQAGSIDVSGNNGGQVQLLADQGQIQVSGTITADGSVGNLAAITIGRDPYTGILAASTDVSGASLSARNGFVETSADWLKTDGVSVKAAQWLLDPADVTISSGADSGYTNSSGSMTPNSGVGSSVVNVNTIDTALNNGTSVTITTTNSGTAGSSNGNIYVNAAIQKTAGTDATLTLNADNTLSINSAITSTSGKLNVVGTGNGAVAGSNGVTVSGTTISTNGGDVTLTGSSANGYGVYVAQGSAISAGNATLNGTGSGTGIGVLLDRDVSISATAALTLNGTNSGTGNAVLLGSNPSTTAIQLTSGTTTTISGTATNAASAVDVLSLSDFSVNASGDVKINATVANSAATGVHIYKSLSTGNNIVSTGGDVKVTTNQGGIVINGASGSNGITGNNVYIDNTGGTIGAGSITAGSGTSTGTSVAGVLVNAGVQATSGNIAITGNGGGGGVNVGAVLTANTSSSQKVLVNGATSTDSVTNYGVQFGGSAGITAGSYTINGTSTATGNQNGSAGVYLAGTFTAQQNSSVTGASSNAAGQSAGVVLAANASGNTTLNLSQTSGTLSINGSNNFNGSRTLSGSYTALDMSGVSSYGTTNISSGTVNVTGTGSSGNITGTTVANRTVDGSGNLLSTDQGYVRSSGFLNAGTVNVSNAGTALTITGSTSGAVQVLTSNNYTWTNPVTSATSSVTDKALVAKAGVSLIGGSINYGAGTSANISGTSTTTNIVGGNGAGFSNYNDSSTATGSLSLTSVTGGQISGTSVNASGVYFVQSGGMTVSGGSTTITANSTNNAGMFGAGITASNAATLNINATGKTNGFNNGGGAGILSTGSNTTVNLTGTASSGTGVSIQGYVHGAAGGNVNITGTSTAGGEGVNLLNGSTWCGTSDCGFGAIGGTTAGNVSVTGSSASGHGVDLGGIIQSQSKIAITGTTSAAGSYGAYLPAVGINIASGGSANSGDAVTITGNNSAVAAAGTGHGVYLAAGKVGNNVITSSSNGGALTISSANSGITVGSTASILNNSTAGAVTLSAGNNTASSAATITSQAAALITQKGSGGVTVSTDGNGNVTAPGIINIGSGDITLSAGKLHAAGDATGGQVLTVSGNGAANLGGGKLKVYSGSSTATGNLSYLTSLFNTLYYNGSSNALNAQFNTAAGGAISGSSSTAQVLFREVPATYPSFTISLANLSKTYGDADPTNLTSALQTAYTAGGGMTTLTKAVGNNTFGLAASDVISSLTGTRAAGENVGSYAYNLSVGSGLNTTLSAQPNMVIGKRNITINTLSASNKVYDGTTAATITGATFNNMANGETLGLSGSGTFDNKNVGNGKTVTVSDVTALSQANGTGLWSNYNLTSTGSATTSANVTQATLTLSAATNTKTYDGTTSASATPVVVSGLATGDTVTGLTESYADKNAGTGKTLNVNSGYTVNDGNGGNNYTVVTQSNTSGVINKATLTLQASANTKTYDGTTSASAAPVVASGLATGDTVTGLTESYADKNAGTGKTLNVNSGYTVNDGNSGNNYTVVTQSNTNGVINKANATVSGTATTVTYNGATQNQSAATSSGFISGDVITISGAASGRNAGTYTSSLSVGGTDAGNYNVTVNNANLTINKATLTLQASANTKTYDGTTSASAAPVVASGLATSDTVTGLTESYADKNAGTGKTLNVNSGYTVNDGNSGNNYTVVTQSNTNGVINKANATVSGTATTVTYNGATQNQSAATSSGFISGDVITISGAASGRNAGTYTSSLSVGGTDAGNYNVTVNNANLTINKASLTLQAVTDTKTYDGGTTSSGAPTSSGLQGSDTINGLAQSFTDKNAGTGKTLTVNGGYTINDGNSGNNYIVTTQTVSTGTINKATLTANLQGSVSKVYDGTTAASIAPANVNLSGFVSGEGAAVNATSGIYASKNVVDNQGSGAVSVSLQPSSFTANSNTSLSNYTLPTSATGNVGTITPAALTVKVNDTAMFVTQDPNLAVNNGFSYTGFKNGETAATALVGGNISNSARTYSGSSNPVVGTYNNVYGLASTPVAVNGNYTVTVQNGNLQVVPAGQLLITVNGQQKNYGTVLPGNAGATAQTVTAQYLDTSGGSVISSLTMQNMGNGVWKATDSTNSSVTFNLGINGAQASSGGYLNVGNYVYNSSNMQPASTANFTGSYTNGGVLTITPKALTSGTVSKVYDGVNTQSNAAVGLSGLMSGDVVNATAATATYASKNVGAAQAVTLQGTTLHGADAGNYSITDQNTTGNITKASLVLSAVSNTKTYDGTTTASATPILVSGLVSGDTVSGLSESYLSKNALGVNGSTLTVSSYTIGDGNGGNNYSVTTNSAVGTINPKALLVSGTTVKNKYYDGTTSASVVPGTLSGLIGSETLGLAASGSFADAQVGQNKMVAVAYTLANGSNGGLAQNYYVGTSRTPFQASILPDADPVKPVNPIRPVDPVNPYTPVNPVKPPFFDPSGGKDHADGHISFDKREETKACSRLHPENCTCEDTLVPSVQVCYVTPDVKMKKNENELRVSRLF